MNIMISQLGLVSGEEISFEESSWLESTVPAVIMARFKFVGDAIGNCTFFKPFCLGEMAYKQVKNLFCSTMYAANKRNSSMKTNLLLFHCSNEPQEEILRTDQWYEMAFAKLKKLTHLLKNVDLIDGRLINIDNDSIVFDEYIAEKMIEFKSLSRAFLGCPSVQQALQKNVMATTQATQGMSMVYFGKASERAPLTVNSLTTVCNFLNISAQQRKVIRLTVSPQVTQHQIWMGTLEEILNGLKSDMETLDYCNKGNKMGLQIVSTCLKFLHETAIDPDSTSWMKPAPTKPAADPASNKWEDVLEMFNDLIACLRDERRLSFHVSKLEFMKEGLLQIRDVLIDKKIGYREVRHQESLVQKKLSKTLGHSSKCMFTLLQYYLYGTIRDVEVDICGGLYGGSGKKAFYLCMGKLLTSDEENMVWSGVKQLDRALRLFKFVWETAGMKRVMELQGHLWCVGAVCRTITYRGNLFFVHGINLVDQGDGCRTR
ncbi:hypothetical protein RJ641_022225 [Dillenia turbinata]|uniref:Uncharacterized protein n=1 Tax=Dillenia turbinata TaxID=194707 RepID=A0AAN8UEQ4_9MAGN